MERPIVSVVEIDPSDELNEFIRDFLKKRRAEDAGFAEIDGRLKAQERRIVELEAELKEYKATEYDRFCIFRKDIHIHDIDPSIDAENITDEDREDIFRQEYYRRISAFEAERTEAERRKCAAAFNDSFMVFLRGQKDARQANCDTAAQP